MESSTLRTRILVSPSLSAPIPFTDDLLPFPSFMLPDPTRATSFVNLPAMDPASGAMTPAALTSINIESNGFFQLSDLLSLDTLQVDPFMNWFVPSVTNLHSVERVSLIKSSAPQKRLRPRPQCSHPPPLLSPPIRSQLSAPGPIARRAQSARSSERARQRRQIIGERTRALENLLPWRRRADTAGMFEEAGKYIKFLEAQVTALESMPAASFFSPVMVPSGIDFHGLERLTRQQLLQVMVNSATVQDMLYKRGFCVVSAEQLSVLRQAMQRRLQPLLLVSHLGSTTAL